MWSCFAWPVSTGFERCSIPETFCNIGDGNREQRFSLAQETGANRPVVSDKFRMIS